MNTCLISICFTFKICSSLLVTYSGQHEYMISDARVDLSLKHEVIFVVRPLNIDAISKRVNEVSDPLSNHYGSYLSSDTIASMCENIVGSNSLRLYLIDNRVKIVEESLYGEFVTASASVGKWELLFDTKFYWYHHKYSDHQIIRVSHYTLDDRLSPHIATVFNLIHFPISVSRSATVTSMVANTASITPANLQNFYNIFLDTAKINATITIYSTSGQNFSSVDLASFQSRYNIPLRPIDSDPNHRNNPASCIANVDTCLESSIDIEYITAIARGAYTSIT